jgi:hypothetical protein
MLLFEVKLIPFGFFSAGTLIIYKLCPSLCWRKFLCVLALGVANISPISLLGVTFFVFYLSSEKSNSYSMLDNSIR